MNKKSGIVDLRILIVLKGQLKNLVGKRHFSMLMFTKSINF